MVVKREGAGGGGGGWRVSECKTLYTLRQRGRVVDAAWPSG